MTTSPSEGRSAPVAATVSVTDDDLVIALVDGRTVSVPLAWYPRLLRGSREERTDWRLIGRGIGIHWPALDEDIKVEHVLAGIPSGEGPASLQRWIASRQGAA